MFSEKEVAYLKTQPLARIATVSKEGQPDVSPVCFDFDRTYFYVGRVANLAKTFKFKNIQENPRVALVIDDLESLDPFQPRAIKIHGMADLVTREGYVGSGMYIRIKPVVIWSGGIEAPALQDDKPIIKKTKVALE